MKGQDSGSIGNAIGLQSLLDEPVRLASEAERLNVELESLVMDNYKVFVENLTCSVHLKLEVFTKALHIHIFDFNYPLTFINRTRN